MARERKSTTPRTRGVCAFTQGDLDRGIKAARKNGFKVRGIELKMTLIVEDDDGAVNEISGDSDWDKILSKRKSKS